MQFIEKAITQLGEVLQPHWEIDHICYRTKSLDEYAEVKKHYSQKGKLLIESPIAGRPIATFKLDIPLVTTHGQTHLLEVPAPKAGKITASGFEHIEIVTDQKFEDLVQMHPRLNWDHRATEKSINPELEAQFADFNIKFHHHALDCIIELEKNLDVMQFIPSLQAFSEFEPLISGTIPLGIATENSDLDILMSCANFDQLAMRIKKYFPTAVVKNSKDHLVASFFTGKLPIEIYAENKPPLKQKAHRHLRIENRLLKLLGEDFKRQIKQLKRDGLKTEPAFGKLLDLKDPYEELLLLYPLSDTEILDRIKKDY